ncbi:hypothetical protein C0Q70_08613 [Pomacea canaliculata]|uniref:RING-type domain-containing protein n=1 Tax=Pomacea canaliculata TaxID=400727 RepID=A0A2T7P7G3_POMCA|nr:hypothetical protein C0Q70_08613 [Pomacea canaliculata]
MALSVAKLKALLEQRGVSYDTVVEKSELCQLVDGSGQLDADEVENLQLSEDLISSDTNFTSGTHFYEQVEDAKDSVWLVQVLAYSQQSHYTMPLLPDTEWKAIRKKVTRFGVHTGILDCELDHRWCEGRGWHTPRLLLALPQVHQQKANVATHTYPGNWRQHLISQWIRQKLQEKVETIQDFRQFKDEWLTFRSAWEDSEIRAVLFSREEVFPMFFSALSVKFPGGRFEEEEESWFNFSQMRTLTHLHPNYFFEPMHLSGYDLSGRIELFGSRLLIPTLSSRPVVSTHYISLLPTWYYGCVTKSVTTCYSKHSAASTCSCHTGGAKRVPDNLNLVSCQTTPDSECQSSGLSCTCYTSALDLLDGNYHCECQGSVKECRRNNKAVPSLTCEPDSSHVSSNSVECPNQKDHYPSRQDLQSKESSTCHHHSTCTPECKTHTPPLTEFPDGYLACSQCVICLEEFFLCVKLCGLPCGHIFHHVCIIAWLSGDHHFCPICRWPSFRSRSHEASTANDT